MPPNHIAYDTLRTPGTASIRGSRLTGSDCVIDRREHTIRRLAPSTLPPELNATRTESSIPNSRNAATTDNSVSSVRVLLRNSCAQTSERYFIATLRSVRQCRRVDELTLVQVDRVGGVFGRLRIMRDHDDGLAVVAIEHLQQLQDLLGRVPVEVAGRLVADEEGRVGHDRARDRHALLLAAGQFVGLVRAAIGQADQLQRD